MINERSTGEPDMTSHHQDQDDPLVSIIIPTYQRPKTLDRALASCMAQTYQAIEIIVVDDNQPDSAARRETAALMQAWSGDPRVRYICRSENGGGALARNSGIAVAKGAYITFLDDDDVYFPDKIAEQVRKMNQGYDMIFGDIELYHSQTGFCQISSYKTDFTMDYKGLLTKHLVNIISGTPTFMYTRTSLLEIGGFDNIAANQEYVLMLKTIVARLKIGYLPKVLCRAYVDDTQDRISNSDKIIRAKIDVLQRIRPYLQDLSRADARKTLFRLYLFIFNQSIRKGKVKTLLYGFRLIPYLDLLLRHKWKANDGSRIVYR